MTHFVSTNPATGETVWEGEAASVEQVGAAVEAARAAFPEWADRPRQDRIDAVKRYQAVLKERAPEMAEASTEALILSPTEAGLAAYRADGRWNQLQETDVRPWTDDYVNLVGSLWRHIRR